jgi:gliding motility-associated-like protein
MLYSTTIKLFVKSVLSATAYRSAIGKLIFTLLFAAGSLLAIAQPCNNNINNNSIQVTDATCVGTVATLRGSTPTGGFGANTYTYQWQKSAGNCNSSNFMDIPGATARDYAVPAATANGDCFRRIVRSGACTSTSNNERIQSNDRTTPQPPTANAIGSSCLVGSGIITVSSPSPGSGIFYSVDGTNYNNTSGIFTGLAPGTYPVTVFYPAGCYSPVSTEVVNAFPPVSGSISPASATICAGDSQVLTVSGGNSYQWYKNNVAIANATTNKFTAKEAGTYTADIIVGVCSVKASNSVVVTVNPSPSGSISPAQVTVCAGASATLTANGGTSYQWYRGNAALSGQTNATLNVSQQGVYTVDVINSFGCKAKASNSAEVTVIPTPSGAITPSSGTLCGSGSVQLSVSGGTSYQWYLNNVAINGANTATYSATVAGTYTATITSGSCTAPAGNSAVITQLVQSASISPANATLCPNTNLTLTLSPTSGSIQWYRDNQKIDGAVNSTFDANLPGTYSVIIINGSCTTQATNVAVLSAGVNPTGIITPASASLCPGASVTLTAVPAASGYTVQWFRNGQFLANANSTSFTTSQTGQYNVVFTIGGCNANSQNIVTVTQSEPIVFTTTKTDIDCNSPEGKITITGVTGGGNQVYRYSKDNGATYQTAPSFSGLTEGTYQVKVRDTAGCFSASQSVTIQKSGSPPSLKINNPPKICPDRTVNLKAAAITAGSDTGLVFTYWADTAATVAITKPDSATPGKYFIKATNSSGCAAIKPVEVTRHDVIPGTITPATAPVACVGTSVELRASTGTAYQWYRNDSVITGARLFRYLATTAGEYSVVISNGTCAVAASNKVKLAFQPCVLEPKVFVPTAFTPNKNGANDLLRPIFYNVVELKYFKVFNRWGQEVFQTNEAGKGWDGLLKGAPQPADTYSWILECIGKNGVTIKQSGRSLLIR